MLLTLVGVLESVVIQDYLLTNIYTAATIQAEYNGMVAADGQALAGIYLPFFGVQASFLTAGFDQATTSDGSMSGYIMNGLVSSLAVRLLARSL